MTSCDFVYDPDDDCPGTSSGDQFMVDMNALIGIPRSEHDSNYVIRLILNQSLMKQERLRLLLFVLFCVIDYMENAML